MSWSIDSIKKSQYLTRADVDPPVTVTISEVREEKMSDTDELKAVVHFKELAKGLVLNVTNSESIALHYGSIEYAGKRTGGIRVRRPTGTSNGATSDESPITNDDVPF